MITIELFKLLCDIERGEYLHCNGVSTYRGVLILWDEDFDTRVQLVIDQLSGIQRRHLIAIREHKATLDFIVPEIYPDFPGEFHVDGDVFVVNQYHDVRE